MPNRCHEDLKCYHVTCFAAQYYKKNCILIHAWHYMLRSPVSISEELLKSQLSIPKLTFTENS